MGLYKIKTSKRIFPFATTFSPGAPNLKKIVPKHLITGGNNMFVEIYPSTPIAACRNSLVRTKISSI